MIIDREPFLSALELVSPGLSTRDVVEQASCFVFRSGRVFTFNDEIACSCITKLKATGAVPADPLKEILKKIKDDTLEVEETKSELLFKGKGRKVGLTKDNEIQLPLENLEVPKSWKPLPPPFGEAIEFVQDCVDRDEAQFPLTCIHLTPGFVEAFDNYQFARHQIELDIRNEFLVRQPSLKAIISLSMVEFSEGKEWVHFRNSDGLMLSCRRWKEKYLDLSKIAAASGHDVVLPPGLIEAADRAGIFSENNEHKSQVRVDLKQDRVILRGEGVYGWYEERKKVTFKGKPFSFLIHPQMLIRLLKRQTKCQINDRILKVEFGKKGEGVFVTSLTPITK